MKKVKFGMVGGGLGSFIGDVHRHGALMDDLAILCAGCFSRHRDKNIETAQAWDIPEDRVYENYKEMADRESSRGDGIDFVKAALNCDFERAFEFLGGTHGKQKVSDKIKAYRMRQEAKKRREAKEREQNAKREMHKKIHELKKIAETAEPFSDEWCAAVEESERLKVELGLYDD